MNHGTRHPGESPTSVLRERCGVLGLPTWCFEVDGTLSWRPREGGALGLWLRSGSVMRSVESQARAWMDESEMAPVEAFGGFYLVPIEERRRRRRSAVIVAAVLTEDVFESDAFAQGCVEAGVDAERVRESASGIVRRRGSTIERVSDVVRWMHDDLMEISTSEGNIENLSRQLAESYEEMSLLYKLREYMNELVHPHRFVRQACFELHEVLPFRWVAAGFVPDARRARALAGKVFTSGEMPCPMGMFESVSASLIEGLSPGESAMLDGDGRGALARGDSQVLVFPISRDGDVVGALFVGDKKGLDTEVTNIELKMIEAAAGYVSILIENTGLYEDQRAMFLGTLRALTASIDAKDPYTCGHSERVADLAADLARVHGLPAQTVERVRIAGLVHDIGKIGVPEKVLRKPGRLTDEEFEMMKAHPEIGYHILRDIPQLDDVLPGVLHHHERYDGRGYPHGLEGEGIPLMARIIALADSFDAMRSTRTYRSAMSREHVLAEIRKCAGSQFDPELAEKFVKLDFRAYEEAAARHQAGLNDQINPREAA